MDKKEIIIKLKAIIKDALSLNGEKLDTFENIDETSDLLNCLGMSSIDVLQVLGCIEEEFGIYIEDDELNLELIRSFASICTLINDKIQDKA